MFLNLRIFGYPYLDIKYPHKKKGSPMFKQQPSHIRACSGPWEISNTSTCASSVEEFLKEGLEPTKEILYIESIDHSLYPPSSHIPIYSIWVLLFNHEASSLIQLFLHLYRFPSTFLLHQYPPPPPLSLSPRLRWQNESLVFIVVFPSSCNNLFSTNVTRS